MSQISEEYLNKVLSKVASLCGFEKWTYERETFENIAQNYFGVIIPFVLNGEKHGANESLRIVFKLAPNDERYRVSGAVTHFFAREIFVYSNILPKYREIQSRFSSLKEFIVPHCYYLNKSYCEEAIAIQNMCSIGYFPFIDESVLNIEHITVSLKSLAEFHALSFLLKAQDPKLYEVAQTTCIPLSTTANERFMIILLDRLYKALDKFSNTDYTLILKQFERNCDNHVNALFTSVNATVLCHGDIWKENLLFKYKDGRPISACIIDYQTTRISSPAYDVLYLIITSTSSQLRKQYYHQLLDIYFTTFKNILSEAQMPLELYSRSMFDEDLKTVAPACTIIANTAIWLSSGLQQEGHVRSKIVLETDKQWTEAVQTYKNRISSIVDDLTSYGYFTHMK